VAHYLMHYVALCLRQRYSQRLRQILRWARHRALLSASRPVSAVGDPQERIEPAAPDPGTRLPGSSRCEEYAAHYTHTPRRMTSRDHRKCGVAGVQREPTEFFTFPTQGRKGKPEMIDLTTAPGLGADAPDQLFNRPVTR